MLLNSTAKTQAGRDKPLLKYEVSREGGVYQNSNAYYLSSDQFVI